MPYEARFQALLKQAGTTYPAADNLHDHSVQRQVNRAIKEAAFAAIPPYDPGTPIIEATAGYTTPLNQNNLLSLRFQDFIYPQEAAHGVTQVSSITIDLRDAHVYKFCELFLPGYQLVLTRIIQTQITARQIPLLQPYAGVGPEENYYLTPDSLVIYYQPYVYTPGAFGVLEFTIPYCQIIGIINPRGPIGRLVGPLG